MRTFNCWVVLVDEVALDQLDGQARFTHTTATDDDQLVFSEELWVFKDKMLVNKAPVSCNIIDTMGLAGADRNSKGDRR